MNQIDIPTLSARLNEMADALGCKPVSDIGVKAWLMALRDFAIEAVVDALDAWLRTKAKMPTPAEIRSICVARLSDRIESKSAVDKAEFASAARAIIASPSTRRLHLDRIAAMLCGPPSDPRDWARSLREREKRGENLQVCQRKAWRIALVNSIPDESEREARLEREGMQAESSAYERTHAGNASL